MGEDEETTIRTLTAYREVMTTLIQQHQGRVVDSPGDNLLADAAPLQRSSGRRACACGPTQGGAAVKVGQLLMPPASDAQRNDETLWQQSLGPDAQ
jgi:hypothetical protein